MVQEAHADARPLGHRVRTIGLREEVRGYQASDAGAWSTRYIMLTRTADAHPDGRGPAHEQGGDMPFLLRAAIVGGAAYHVGKKVQGGRDQDASQQQLSLDLRDLFR